MRKVAAQLRLALEQFRLLDPEIPIQQVVMFLIIARNTDEPEGTSQRELSDQLGIAISSVSRNLASLYQEDRWGRPGHQLIEREPDPNHSQKFIYRLSPKGKQIMTSLSVALGYLD